jgi:hypothetical protein
MKHSLYSEFLFPELDDGRNRVSKVGDGGFIGGKLELQHLQGETRVKEVKGKKWWKVVKSQGSGVSLVVGEDVGVNQILDLEGKTLVGKFMGWRVTLEQLGSWIQ